VLHQPARPTTTLSEPEQLDIA
jgi:hypothetical protein